MFGYSQYQQNITFHLFCLKKNQEKIIERILIFYALLQNFCIMFIESEKYQKRKQNEKILNKIQIRTEQLSQILDKNNSLFMKGLPSKDRMLKILEHCYNCYDQLDYIMLQNTQNALAYVDPKRTAEQAHKIMRTTKYLMNNVKCWMLSNLNNLDSYQQGISCFFPQKANYQPQCSTCNCYLEALLVKQAKQEIFGYQNLKEDFQFEIREQKEQKTKEKTPQQSKESTQYISSVNFLTKLIKQMQQTALTYEQLAQRIQNDDQRQSLGVVYLEELLANFRIKLGYKFIQTLKKVIRTWENDQGIENGQQRGTKLALKSKVIHEAISPNNVVRNNIIKQQELAIKKLRSNVSDLEIQRNCLLQNFKKLNSSLNYLQIIGQTKDKAQERQIPEAFFNKLLVTKGSLVEHENFSKNIQEGKNHSVKIKIVNQHERMLAQRKRGLFSKFNVQKFSKQQGERTNEDNAINETDINKTQLQGQQNYRQLYDKEFVQFKDVGCQYEPIATEQKGEKVETTEKKLRDSKLKKIVQRNSMKKNMKPRLQNATEQSTEEIFRHRKSTNKSLKSLAALQRQKNNDGNPRFSIQQNKIPSKSVNKVNPIKYIQTNFRTQAIEQQSQVSNRLITSVQNFQQQNRIKQRQQGHKINIYSSTNKLKELNLASTSIRQSSNIITVGSFKQNTDTLIKKISHQKQNGLSEENQLRKKIRLVRNILFQPQNLSLFGGVSESYSYEKYVAEKRELSPEQKKYFQSLSQYLQNLQNFKTSVYQNVVLFLSNPFEFIDKNQLEFQQIGIKKLEKILMKFICFHSKKCKHLECNHIINFNILIGLLSRS